MESTPIFKMKSIAEECINVYREYSDIVTFAEKYDEKIQACVKELLDCEKPRVMVCGVYSAGKSTLVNTLLREDIAAIGAQPKTDKVTEYKNNNKDYILVDSPGVDAPIEHEKITDDFIKKCNAVMFVVSTKNAESEANYRKINEWMQYEKPLIIVLNDKSGGIDLDSEEINVIRKKIEQNLRQSGYDRDKNYEVIAVNAQMGYLSLKNSDENKKNIFLQKSKIYQLESLINKKLKEGYAIYLAPIGELQRNLDGMERELSILETGVDDNLYSKLEMLNREANNMNESIRRQIKNACDEGRQKLIEVCLNGNSQEMIDTTVANVAGDIMKTVDSNYKRQLSRLSTVVNANMDKYGIKMSDNGIISIKGMDIDFANIMYQSADALGQGDSIKNAIGGAVLGEIVGTAAGGLAASGALGGLGGLGAALAGVPLGPIGIIGGAILGFLFGSKNDERDAELRRQVAEENRRIQEARDAQYKKLQVEIGSKMDQVELEYVQKSTEVLSAAIANLKETINKEIADKTKYNENIAEARRKISELKSKLDGLKTTIQ